MLRIMMAVTVALGGAGAANATDRTAAAAIVAGDMPRAERILTAERRIFPRRAELMLNLAAVYRHTGRDADARSLYAAVLNRPEVMMDLPDRRIASSHALARAGLVTITQFASR